MNRAFVKESDLEDRDPLPERAHSDLPNYITRRGLAALEETVAGLQRTITDLKSSDKLDARSQMAGSRRDLDYFAERLRRAIPVDTPVQSEHVELGHAVTLQDENNECYRFVLVGEDEIDIGNGCISWASPIARKLAGRQMGDQIVWLRGGEELVVEIVAIDPA